MPTDTPPPMTDEHAANLMRAMKDAIGKGDPAEALREPSAVPAPTRKRWAPRRAEIPADATDGSVAPDARPRYANVEDRP